MDELLSYELSNAEYNPWIVPTQPEGRLASFVHNEIDSESFIKKLGNIANTVKDVIANRSGSLLLSYKASVYDEPVFIDREAFRDYITVDKTDDFNYLSVYFNVKDDNHPFLYFAALHTVSSLFKRLAEPFVGCLVNLILILLTMTVILYLGRLIFYMYSGDERISYYFGLFASLFFGFGSGAVSSVVFVRMYCMVAFFVTLTFYITLNKLWKTGFKSKNKGLIAVTIAGFLTQYFYLLAVIPLFVCVSAILLKNKRVKDFLIYLRSMVIAAVVGVAVFPFCVSDVLSSTRGTEAIDNLKHGLSGFGERLISFYSITANKCLGNGICFGILFAMGIAFFIYISLKRKNGGYNLIWIVGICYFLMASRLSPYMVDRYMMPVFPLICVVLAFAFAWLVMLLKNNRFVPLMLLCLTFVMSGITMLSYDGEYLYEDYDYQLILAKRMAKIPCICVYDGVSYYENLLEFEYYTKTLLVKENELFDYSDTESIEENNRLMLILKRNVDDEDVLEYISGLGYEVIPNITDTSVYGDRLYLCEKEE